MLPDLKSLTTLLEALNQDLRFWSNSGVSHARDGKTVRARIEYEGLSFLTITLPTFGQDFDRSLARKSIDSSSFAGFAKKGPIPNFMSGMVSRVFDTRTGTLLDNPCVGSIDGVRQMSYLFKKINAECSPKRERLALRKYIECDRAIRDPYEIPEHYKKNFYEVLFWVSLDLSYADESVKNFMLLPKHGPGAVAEGTTPNKRWDFQRWHQRLEDYFPYTEYAIANLGWLDNLETAEFATQEEEQPIRVVTVPKTMKGPRVIGIEPSCMQYAQQAAARALIDALSRGILGPVLPFRDQTRNREAALQGSKTGNISTIDLSEASDRIPNTLVRKIFQEHRYLGGLLQSSRSGQATVKISDRHEPETIQLQKFASMGSGVCFVVEALVFALICLAAMHTHYGVPVTRASLRRYARRLLVFGDDIIVPKAVTPTVIDALEAFGLKVNRAKTYSEGNFRESCGMDAYDGVPVTPVYLRSFAPSDRRDLVAIASWNSTANQFLLKGYWATCDHIRKKLEKLVPLPYGSANAGYVSRLSFSEIHNQGLEGRYDTSIQGYKVKALTAKAVYRDDKVSDGSALMKCLASMHLGPPLTNQESTMPDPVGYDKEHLTRSARHGAAAFESRWCQVT